MDNAATVGEYAIDALTEIMGRHHSIGDVRGKGLMIGVEFVTDRETKEPAKELTERIIHLAFDADCSCWAVANPLSASHRHWASPNQK